MGTREIPTGDVFRLAEQEVGLDRATGRAQFMVWDEPGPPPTLDGYTVGAWQLETEPPHDGERHPDADELLFLVSGRVRVRLELPDGDRHVQLGSGDALVVPRGVWHKITIEEPGQLVNITPGPNQEHRPLPGGGR